MSTAAIPMLHTYAGLATASGLFGLSIGANYTLAAVILVSREALRLVDVDLTLGQFFAGRSDLAGTLRERLRPFAHVPGFGQFGGSAIGRLDL